MSAPSKLEEEIGLLAGLPREELVTRWHRIYRCPPPKGLKRGLLERAIAWHLQAKHYGGLSPALRRQLREEAAGDRNAEGLGSPNINKTASRARPSLRSQPLAPGSRLIRQWHGRSFPVDVVEDGFVFEGRTYASLSAIAREITGARWSGPRFFGL